MTLINLYNCKNWILFPFDEDHHQSWLVSCKVQNQNENCCIMRFSKIDSAKIGHADRAECNFRLAWAKISL